MVPQAPVLSELSPESQQRLDRRPERASQSLPWATSLHRAHAGSQCRASKSVCVSSSGSTSPGLQVSCSAHAPRPVHVGHPHLLQFSLEGNVAQPRRRGPLSCAEGRSNSSHLAHAHSDHLVPDMGVELFVIDDGWFSGRDNDRAGLGDWTVNTRKFPSGLRPVIDRVHELGMGFGIWVEPEVVNPDSELYRAHPEWVYHFSNRSGSLWRNQLVLNLARDSSRGAEPDRWPVR